MTHSLSSFLNWTWDQLLACKSQIENIWGQSIEDTWTEGKR